MLVDQFLAANVSALVALYTLVAYAPRKLAAIGFAIALAGTVPFTAHVDDFTLRQRAADLAGARRSTSRSPRCSATAATPSWPQRERLAELAAAAERARIARELHDVIAHSLSVVIAQADGGRYGATDDPSAAADALKTISSTAREALAEMRRALGIRARTTRRCSRSPARDELPALVARTRAAGLPVRTRAEAASRGRSRPPPAWPSTASPRRR